MALWTVTPGPKSTFEHGAAPHRPPASRSAEICTLTVPPRIADTVAGADRMRGTIGRTKSLPVIVAPAVAVTGYAALKSVWSS